jgi:hypothetical protein
MRPAAVAGFVLALLPTAAPAQTGPYLGTVTDPEARLRAGPSDKFPETGTVRRGVRVVVDHEEPNGWLAVEAPQGQVSWVQWQFVEGFDPKRPTPQLVAVSLGADEGEITLNPGRPDAPEPLLDIRRMKVPNGTALTTIGPKVTFGGKSWYPVTPPAGDFRYLPKTAVQFEKPANTSFVVRDTAPPGLPPAGVAPAAGIRTDAPAFPPATPPKPVANHPLWAQAEEAEKAGRLDEAEKLFFQLARVMNEPGGDHDVANLCYTRIHTLREKKRSGGATGSLPPAAPGTPATRPADSRATLLPPVADDRTGPARPPVAVTPASTTTPSPATPDSPAWTGPGTLTRSALALDGRRTYSLESSPGVVKVYVVGAQGTDLDRFANRKVDLYGTTHTRRDLSKPYVVVTQVEPNP